MRDRLRYHVPGLCPGSLVCNPRPTSKPVGRPRCLALAPVGGPVAGMDGYVAAESHFLTSDLHVSTTHFAYGESGQIDLRSKGPKGFLLVCDR